MKRRIELTTSSEYRAGESDWCLGHVDLDTMVLTDAKGMRWALMIIGNRRPDLKWRWAILLLVQSIGVMIVAIVVTTLAMGMGLQTGSEEKHMRKKRTLAIELYNEDMGRLCKKAESVSMTARELLENFIAGLIRGERTNGSDERECADRWFDRCGFAILKDGTLLVQLTGTDVLDDVARVWEEIRCINQMGIKSQDDQEELDEYQDELKTWFNEYKDAGGEYDELEDEMKKTMVWKRGYDHLMERKDDEEARPEPNEH